MTKSELKEDNQMLGEKLVELYERIEHEKIKRLLIGMINESEDRRFIRQILIICATHNNMRIEYGGVDGIHLVS
ncbi:MAG: hypothetical protein HFI20_10925 [Lachnospiraceae bacterium]|jgi:hypothetical protein|nr:hypothetical protein [Lachnospiraceae bacterium]MCI9682062.1 hypothetical protein [Lachnospiraceae bacterium]